MTRIALMRTRAETHGNSEACDELFAQGRAS
ncbi:MAG: hypothetical protein ACI915_001989 [Gammaproteobacteria bacterium]|jgi:hypothetical protein